ncbi:Wzz/FepE/Etk N-terminal domain-containing protein [Aliarcobacter butzleri]|uniref:Wzz/FepE/Etk N-terminal domain-containing protein n=1 Tax=Aliarcobacter butzleri TaxID=28197 RepID=UPI0021B35322|nr:Wzz/FepE/Etk N-terminal domain-containing protein [Aliarcobacter butzleri]MCT7612972.1 Wzz/FepE/Etk N-terminal domain-containing protein [Aliarcobacter butzleri]MCT7641607.1 Wzz/FepE/Etk N-terminal domain-containing protein [Aliarcobacter butzleri]
MQNQKYLQDDEIDLKELFKTIWSYKKFILIFTFIVTVLSIIYVSLKTPVYEVTALVEVGSYKTESGQDIIIDNADNLSKKLTTIFIDLRKNVENKDFEITKIVTVKGMKNFIEISSEASSNTQAIEGLNEVIEHIKSEHTKLLDDVKEKNEFQLKNISLLIKNIEDDQLVNIEKKIELYNQNIVSLEQQMTSVTETLKNINKLDPSISALKLMEKRDISNAIISNKSNLYDLIEKKENLVNVEINKLLDRKKILETLSLPHNLKNSEVVGSILVNEYPIKPKKSLIVVVSFVTGFILSIFLVFFIEFIRALKKEEIN